MGSRVDTIKMNVRTKLKGDELEVQLREYVATTAARNRIEEAKDAAMSNFKSELKEKDEQLAEQFLVLDKGKLESVDVEVVTGSKGKKTYKRLDTGENLDEDDIPEQMEIPVDGDTDMEAND